MQQHWLIHKLIQQINGFEDEIYVSTDGTLPSNGHSRDQIWDSNAQTWPPNLQSESQIFKYASQILKKVKLNK